jgi:hypothetical protein
MSTACLSWPSETRAASVLHWLFRRDSRALSCDVSVDGDEQFVVRVIPLWDDDTSIVETFKRPIDALQRHAEIVSLLRESGWLLSDRGVVARAV